MDADFRCEVLAENDFNTVIEIKKIMVYSKCSKGDGSFSDAKCAISFHLLRYTSQWSAHHNGEEGQL